MYKTRRIAALILSVAMISSLVSISASAQEAEMTHEHDETSVQPRYYLCPGGGKHPMTGRGIGWIYSGSYQNPGSLQVYGFANQCTQCNFVLASEGNPRNSRILGKYAMRSYSGNASNNGVAIYGGIDGSYYGNLLEDPFWAGLEFI